MTSGPGSWGDQVGRHAAARGGRPADQRVARGFTPAAVLLAGLLAACASGSPEPNDTGDRARTGDPEAAVEAADPVARFAASAQVGASSQVRYEGRTLNVTVGPYYQSAAGNRCRRLTIRTADEGSYVTGVCRENAVWQTVMVY